MPLLSFMEQLIAHLIGDYILQSEWMANNKTSNNYACFCHVMFYSIPFLFIGGSWSAYLIIVSTHFLIDRFRLAKYLVYAKNFIAPETEIFAGTPEEIEFGVNDGFKNKYKWENCKATGYPSETPPFLAVWLLIIADNTLHLLINYLAIKYL